MIDSLPDDALLEIFTHYLSEDTESYIDDVETWHTLVHVCRRWRYIVFESPCWLNLRIRCTTRTRVTTMLSIWPALPIVIGEHYSDMYSELSFMRGANNIVAALELKDRLHQISFWNYPRFLWERIASVMLGPFPALTSLKITSRDDTIPVAVFPDAFLGGSAPRLRSCFFMGIPFPGIHKLLLSADQLVELTLRDTPHSSYISPEHMVTCLSAMPNLKTFWLGFRSCELIPNQSSRWPLTPAVLPSLVEFSFKGASEYMEGLLPRFDAPLLQKVSIWLFYVPTFETPQLYNFLSRTQIFEACSGASVVFYDDEVYFRHGHQFGLSITGITSSAHWSSFIQICGLSFPPIRTLKRLDVRLNRYTKYQAVGYGGTIQWMEFFRPFTALKYLCLDKNSAWYIVPALRHSHLIAEGATQVLPALQSLFMEGLSYHLQETIEEFVTTRQLSGHPVALYSWDGNSNCSREMHPSPVYGSHPGYIGLYYVQ